LARQISDPTAKDVKASGKLAADALAQLGADIKAGNKEEGGDKKLDVAATDTTTTLPADMLAALLPQAMNTAAATTTGTPATNTKSDKAAIDTQSIGDKRASTAPKAEASVNVQAAATPKTSGENPDVPAKESAFAAAGSVTEQQPPPVRN
jgi:hypothetical protein